MSPQLVPKHAETQCRVAKTIWQRILNRRARNSKTLTRNLSLCVSPGIVPAG